MKTKTIVSDITHDDIVNLLSTALYGSTYMSADYDEERYKRLFKESDCYEDKMARILLDGGSITITDSYAESADELNGKKGKWNEDLDEAQYVLTLNDFKEGLQMAMDGTFSDCSNATSAKSWARKVCCEMMKGDDADYDLPDADMIMQIICFGGLVYG